MSKKIIFIIVCIVLIILIIGIFGFSEEKEESNIANSENVVNEIQNQEESTINSTDSTETEQQENEIISNEVTSDDNSDVTVISQVSPIGFMGSSLYRVVLYSNGNVYVQKFNGEGTEQEDIISESLIAENAVSIELIDDEEDSLYGEVIVTGRRSIR